MESLKEFKEELEEKIKESDQVFISPHRFIDLDAMASAIGFSLISRKFSKPNHIFIYDDEYKIEPGTKVIYDETRDNFSFISPEKYDKLKSDNDLLILTDTNKKNLIGCQEHLDSFKNIAILDHHNAGDETVKTDLSYLSDTSSSTCELLVDLLSLFNVKYDESIANYLLSGIYLDTKKLQNGVTSKTFQVVSKLMDKGADLSKAQELLAEEFKKDLKVQELVQKAALYTYTYALAVGEEDKRYTREELAKVADWLLGYRGVDASFAVGYTEDEIVSISARSRGEIDVSKLMALLNGGGNAHSAATRINSSEIEAVGKDLAKILRPTGFIENK